MASLDPNSLCVASLEADYPFGQAFPPPPSVLSGKPSCLHRADDLEIPLTLDELDRLVRLDLRRREALKLVETYGVFHEVNDDFYVDGRSWQTRPKSRAFFDAKRRIEAQAPKRPWTRRSRRRQEPPKRAIYKATAGARRAWQFPPSHGKLHGADLGELR